MIMLTSLRCWYVILGHGGRKRRNRQKFRPIYCQRGAARRRLTVLARKVYISWLCIKLTPGEDVVDHLCKSALRYRLVHGVGAKQEYIVNGANCFEQGRVMHKNCGRQH